jgi:hypothetical protein
MVISHIGHITARATPVKGKPERALRFVRVAFKATDGRNGPHTVLHSRNALLNFNKKR